MMRAVTFAGGHEPIETPQLSGGYEEAETENPPQSDDLSSSEEIWTTTGQAPEREGAGIFDLVLCQAHRGVEALYAVPLGGIRTPKTQGISWRAQHNTMTIENETLVRLSRQTEFKGHQWAFGAALLPKAEPFLADAMLQRQVFDECPVHAHATVPTAQLAGDPWVVCPI
ncbi:uncharacterized protein Triagg1_6461 [Trichoderma aggressivum f. europaeum]|uniref:Uncharacterized protein n=1 Tax=Trichoderma aggressivum f. europaeum TaxID=173218 RepID=A0AAE1M1V6_9HYPO|nr:hypothetical protein Triagg1_6461 [Trichoderma aggressivum f. europaeum]